MQQAPQVAPVLLEDRLVEAQPVPYVGQHLGGGVLARDQAGGVVGGDEVQDEDHRRHDPHHDDAQEDPAYQEPGHRRPHFSLMKMRL